MNDTYYNVKLGSLCKALQLGNLTEEPVTVSGGLLHRMFSVNTTQGKYAVKALNPQIMLRLTAFQHILRSERIANAANKSVPALSARRFNGNSLQELDDQFYLVFDWVDGKTLKPNEINTCHSEKIGTILADLHSIDFTDLSIAKDKSEKSEITDWNSYLKKGQETNAEWIELLSDNIDKLYSWNTKSNEAAQQLEKDMIISHRDLDSKNVMWIQDEPVIIDWESAGYINPMQDLTETAIYWSENANGEIDKNRFEAFICGYKKKRGNLQADWRRVLENGFSGKLGWLEYSIKRSLWIECTDEKEQQLGTAQVTHTINSIRNYSDKLLDIEEWLKNDL